MTTKIEYHAKAATIKGMLKLLADADKAKGVPKVGGEEKPKAKAKPVVGKYHRAIKTAIQTGWFTNGVLLAKLTADEVAAFKAEHAKDAQVKAADPWPVVETLPDGVTVSLDFVAAHKETDTVPALVELATATGKKVFLRTDFYLFLTRRHPKGSFYMTGKGSDENPMIALSERTTVGVIVGHDHK